MKNCEKASENIILIGYMAVGKSRIGRELVEVLKEQNRDYELLDCDSLIEKEAGCTVAEIFERFGQDEFRKRETNLLKRLSGRTGIILSTGGGMPLKEENRALLKELGTVVYLKAEVSTIADRVRNDKTRPLLKTEKALETHIGDMLKERNPIYESLADITISVDGKSPREIVGEIL